jgi:hypothetical protein
MTTEFAWLEPGERIVWSGKPNPRRFALVRGLMPFFLGVVFIGVASFTFGMGLLRLPGPPLTGPQAASFKRLDLAMDLYLTFMGTLSGGGGLVLALAPVWLWFRARRMTYAVTDRRVVIDCTGPRPRRQSILLEHVRFIELRPPRKGAGDVVVQETMRPGLDGWAPRGEGFVGIPKAAKVEQRLRAAIEATFSSRTRRA